MPACLPAVNKPCYVITAPKHRFTGGSMVNRIIGVCACACWLLRLSYLTVTAWLCMAACADGAARPALSLPCCLRDLLSSLPLTGPRAAPHAVRAVLQGGWALSPSPCTAWT